MVNKVLSFTDLDGNQCTKTYSFNLSQQDFVRMQLKYQPGIQECHAKLMAEGDIQGAYDLLADLIESAYGVREGDSFVKNRKLNGLDTRPDLANFKFHPAFDTLIIELMQDTPTLLEFFRNLTSVQMTDAEFESFAATIKKEALSNPEPEQAVIAGIDFANGPDMSAPVPPKQQKTEDAVTLPEE